MALDFISNSNSNSNSITKVSMVSWEELKEVRVLASDGWTFGKIKGFSQHFIILEKGVFRKALYWIPKFMADAYDGKYLWLILSFDEINEKYISKNEEHSRKNYLKSLELFRDSPIAKVYSKNNPDIENRIRFVKNYEKLKGTDSPFLHSAGGYSGAFGSAGGVGCGGAGGGGGGAC